MLIIDWLMRWPDEDRIRIVKKIGTNACTSSEAVAEANGLWSGLRLRENQHADGFQIVDQDGRMMAAPHFLRADDVAP